MNTTFHKFTEVKSNPESFFVKNNAYKFRAGVAENCITSFPPDSKSFKNSLSKKSSVLLQRVFQNTSGNRLSAQNNYAVCLLPDEKFLSNSLYAHFSRIKGHIVNVNGQRNCLAVTDADYETLTNGKFLEIAVNITADFRSSPSISTLAGVVTPILIALTATETLSNRVVGAHSYINRNIPTMERGIYCRLINIYEPIVGELVCLSILQYSEIAPDEAVLYHCWFNSKILFNPTFSLRHVIFPYEDFGIPYLMANTLWRDVGLSLNPFGQSVLTVNVGPYKVEVENCGIDLERLAYAGVGEFSKHAHNGSASRLFSLSGNPNSFDMSRFGVKYGSTLDASVPAIPKGPSADVTKKLPTIVKFIVEQFLHYNGGQKLTLDTDRLRARFYKEIFSPDAIDSSELWRKSLTEIKQIKSRALQEDLTEDYSNALKITKVSGAEDRPSNITKHILENSLLQDKLPYYQE